MSFCLFALKLSRQDGLEADVRTESSMLWPRFDLFEVPEDSCSSLASKTVCGLVLVLKLVDVTHCDMIS